MCNFKSKNSIPPDPAAHAPAEPRRAGRPHEHGDARSGGEHPDPGGGQPVAGPTEDDGGVRAGAADAQKAEDEGQVCRCFYTRRIGGKRNSLPFGTGSQL